MHILVKMNIIISDLKSIEDSSGWAFGVGVRFKVNALAADFASMFCDIIYVSYNSGPG